MKDIFDVKISRRTLKVLKRMPVYVVLKLQAWMDDVGYHGLMEVRKIPGYHDEPLKGARIGQRSIRLSKFYRAIYMIHKSGKIKFIEIVKVSKHEY